MSLNLTARVFEPDGGPNREPEERVADDEPNREKQQSQLHATVLGREKALLCAVHDGRAADDHSLDRVRDRRGTSSRTLWNDPVALEPRRPAHEGLPPTVAGREGHRAHHIRVDPVALEVHESDIDSVIDVHRGGPAVAVP